MKEKIRWFFLVLFGHIWGIGVIKKERKEKREREEYERNEALQDKLEREQYCRNK